MPDTLTTTEALGRIIRERRKHLDLTQAELAAFAGVSLRALSSIEGGKPTARLDIVMPILGALGLEITVASRKTL